MMNPHRVVYSSPRAGLALAVALLLLATASRAQALRDPTVAPASAGLAATAQPAAQAPETHAMTVIVRDGKPYLVVGTRLLAQGQKLGEARIERIGETEIWLREAGRLRKVPRFAGVQRSPASRIQP